MTAFEGTGFSNASTTSGVFSASAFGAEVIASGEIPKLVDSLEENRVIVRKPAIDSTVSGLVYSTQVIGYDIAHIAIIATIQPTIVTNPIFAVRWSLDGINFFDFSTPISLTVTSADPTAASDNIAVSAKGYIGVFITTAADPATYTVEIQCGKGRLY
jgi:hypothetical protein